jgi:hypothetical protein
MKFIHISYWRCSKWEENMCKLFISVLLREEQMKHDTLHVIQVTTVSCSWLSREQDGHWMSA